MVLTMNSIMDDQPHALADPATRTRRIEMLGRGRMTELIRFVQELRTETRYGNGIPFFDPCDGGIEAEILVLAEAPGPKAVKTGFISRNNPDPSAKNFLGLLQEAGIPRSATILWNIVPWYVGTEDRSSIRPAERQDIADGLPYLYQLLDLLPRLHTIVLLGRKAQQVSKQLTARGGLRILETFHTSARVLNVWPEKRVHILDTLREAGNPPK